MTCQDNTDINHVIPTYPVEGGNAPGSVATAKKFQKKKKSVRVATKSFRVRAVDENHVSQNWQPNLGVLDLNTSVSDLALTNRCINPGSMMERVIRQVWFRVTQRPHRTSLLPRRSHSGCADHVTVPSSTPSRHIRPTPLVSRFYQPSNLRVVGQDSRLQGGMTCKSQRLMQQAGLIHPSNPGCYYYLPPTVRSMEKLVRVIDQEMQGVGGQKVDMPSLCSADLWKASERWDLMGNELFRLKDRHGIDYCLGPTHEEAVTTLVSHKETLSYRQLPLLLYQITRKFRDEPKPKFGLLRGREFYMKDMYSFDVSEEEAYKTYESVCHAYTRLFSRLGLRCVQVQADTGIIGGKLSHEFQLPADIGEDQLLVCGNCSFSANVETMSSDRTDCPQCETGHWWNQRV
ncbi:hypothetical protein Q5P01_015740 [Channa striata]|uniref:proline--tRNA ligase n=1 Tax=Channa striata TaxID=64152 RepID=A0AA88SFK2_CHASR|nr:hypothetical protein Q5P01_015740 [Channa striata]